MYASAQKQILRWHVFKVCADEFLYRGSFITVYDIITILLSWNRSMWCMWYVVIVVEPQITD